jgi:cyclic pyranopterin phosphate synthase
MTEEIFSHLDEAGRPKMVDVTGKDSTHREAIARGLVRMQPSTLALLKKGSVPKGDVLTTARLAGIMAAKKTPELIPLCHPLLLGDIDVDFDTDNNNGVIDIAAIVKSTGQTGVEMEALTAVAVAALTIYDMCKAVDRGVKIDNIRLVKKSGGKSGEIILE